MPATRASLEPRVSDAATPGAYRGLEPGSECEGRSGSSVRAGDSGPRVRGKRRAPGSSASPGSPSNPSALQPLCRPDDPNTLAGAGRSHEAAPGFRRCSLPCGVSAGCSGPACAAVLAENRSTRSQPRTLRSGCGARLSSPAALQRCLRSLLSELRLWPPGGRSELSGCVCVTTRTPGFGKCAPR